MGGKVHMQIFIDADGYPVTRIAAKVAVEHSIPCTVICDTARSFNLPGVQTITVDQGADSVDFRMVNLVQKGILLPHRIMSWRQCAYPKVR